MRIGIDVGGTFTDIVMVDDQTGDLHFAKVLTTPPKLWEGVMNGIAKVLEKASASIEDVDYIVHGTTIGTNALIEKKGAKTGLITTQGFVDILEIGRVQRPGEGLYDFYVENPQPLIPRYLCKGVIERVGADGKVVKALDEDSVREAIMYLKEQKVEGIAVSLLFSFLNPAHERRIAEICKDIFPEAYVSISSEIAPEYREFERTSTTVINAYLQPIMKRYIQNLTQALEEKYGRVDLRIMQASGGTITAEAAERYAINTVNSGPAGGALAGAYFGEITGNSQLITADMGGTSFDIGLIDQGVPHVTSEAKFEGYPVKIPVIDIDTIGAGGGSIAWVDKGGILNVGPKSAGASPGPACYNRDGKLPTVTDANLILGRLNPSYFLGGELVLERDLAYQAIKENVADPMGITVEEAAAGIIRIVNANMSKGIGVNTVEKGHDVREFTMIAFGGAGALHAAELATDMGIKTLIVPRLSGNLSALGLLVSDARHDFVNAVAKAIDDINLEELRRIFDQLEAKGRVQLEAENFAPEEMELLWSADMRYEGQSYELNINMKRKTNLERTDLVQLVKAFNEEHRRLYAYSSEDETVQVVNVRATAVGKTPPVQMKKVELSAGDGLEALKTPRKVYFEGKGFIEVPVYERDLLQPGHFFNGPAIVEEHISSTVVPPAATCQIDQYGTLIIKLEGGENE